MANPLKTYSAIAEGTNIQFKSGLQADLNKMMVGGSKAGQAKEGVFYLTTDTHKLYIGRKSSSDATKVYPEQVSRGVTIVDTADNLPAVNTPSAAQEEGELYYITNKNILAALRKKANGDFEWVQINPSTGVESVTTAINGNSTTTDKIVDLVLTPTTGSPATGKLHIKAGDNVTLTTSNTNSNKEGNITIAATDTTYTINAASDANKGQVTLTDNASTPNTQRVDFEGTGTVKVTSTAAASGTNAKVTIAGPTFTNIQASNASEGFNITLNGKNGTGADLTVTTSTDKLNPVIKHNSNDSTGVKFVNGTATLNVYTQSETNQAIQNAIDGALQVADAMTFKGVVTSANATGDDTSLMALVNNNAHNGDVYKVGANPGGTIEIDGVTADVGDLIIIHGEENESTGKVSYTSGNLSSLLSICQLVPSGDEPEVTASVNQNSTGTINTTTSPTSFQLYDGKNGVNTNILTTKFIGGKVTNGVSDGNILIKGVDVTPQNGSGKIYEITATHPGKDRTDSTNGDKTNITLSTTAGTESTKDSFYDSNNVDQVYNLFVLNGPSALKTDAYGHVQGLQGTTVTFKHNRLKTITPSYGATSIAASGNNPAALQATATLTFEDNIGVTKAGAIKFQSETLTLGAISTGNDQHINVDLKWGTF